MKVIIVGAGEVGFHIARRLAVEEKDVIVIDLDQDALKRVLDHIDVQTVHASGCSPKVLEDAGVADADIILAVTDSDETNLIACFFANSLSPDILKLARLRDPEYNEYHHVLEAAINNLGTIVNPDQEVVKSILQLMTMPGAVEINEFASGRIKLIGTHLGPNSPVTGVKLMDLRSHTSNLDMVIAALVRDDRLIIPSGADVIQPDDIVYFVCSSDDLETVREIFDIPHDPPKNVLIIGGGHIGLPLAKELEKSNLHVKVIDNDAKRCELLSEELDRTVVLQGDGTDQELLQEENIDAMDMAIAITGDEESNILSCLLAKRLGAKKTITRVNKFEYMPLVQAIGIDHMVCPRLSAVNSILHFIRRGGVLSAVSIKGEEAEAMEVVVQENSGVSGKSIVDLKLPRGVLILFIQRGDEVMIPTGNTVIKQGDGMIILSTRKHITKMEKKLAGSVE